jgi:hypothetical protein
MADIKHEPLGQASEFDDATASAKPAPAQAGRRGAIVTKGDSSLAHTARNVCVKPDGTVLVTDDTGKPLARYDDRDSARANLKASGVDLSKVHVAGWLGADPSPPAKK